MILIESKIDISLTSFKNVNNITKRLDMYESFYVFIDNEKSYNALMLIFEASNIRWASGTKASSLYRDYSWFKDEGEASCVFVEYSNIDGEYILWAELRSDTSYYNHTLIHFNEGG